MRAFIDIQFEEALPCEFRLDEFAPAGTLQLKPHQRSQRMYVAHYGFKSLGAIMFFPDIDVVRADVSQCGAILGFLVAIDFQLDIADVCSTSMHTAMEQIDVAKELINER